MECYESWTWGSFHWSVWPWRWAEEQGGFERDGDVLSKDDWNILCTQIHIYIYIHRYYLCTRYHFRMVFNIYIAKWNEHVEYVWISWSDSSVWWMFGITQRLFDIKQMLFFTCPFSFKVIQWFGHSHWLSPLSKASRSTWQTVSMWHGCTKDKQLVIGRSSSMGTTIHLLEGDTPPVLWTGDVSIIQIMHSLNTTCTVSKVICVYTSKLCWHGSSVRKICLMFIYLAIRTSRCTLLAVVWSPKGRFHPRWLHGCSGIWIWQGVWVRDRGVRCPCLAPQIHRFP